METKPVLLGSRYVTIFELSVCFESRKKSSWWSPSFPLCRARKRDRESFRWLWIAKQCVGIPGYLLRNLIVERRVCVAIHDAFRRKQSAAYTPFIQDWPCTVRVVLRSHMSVRSECANIPVYDVDQKMLMFSGCFLFACSRERFSHSSSNVISILLTDVCKLAKTYSLMCFFF